MKKTSLLPDVNVWIALTFRSHAHHVPALTWFKTLQNESILFCRTTQQGFLRLATNVAVFPKDAVNLSGAWQLYDAILMDQRIQFVDEPSGIEPQWRIFTQGSTFSPKVWNDAYLAAFSVMMGCRFVTFDKGFTRYSGLSLTLLP
ncbi:MAG TPA: TA system VapC family ribonuclease toxin [Urbifossiella sp.]